MTNPALRVNGQPCCVLRPRPQPLRARARAAGGRRSRRAGRGRRSGSAGVCPSHLRLPRAGGIPPTARRRSRLARAQPARMLLPCTARRRIPPQLAIARRPRRSRSMCCGDPARAAAEPQLAIVGSRSPDRGGAPHRAAAGARTRAPRASSITSGLARGIDTAAHEGALDAGAAHDRRAAAPASTSATRRRTRRSPTASPRATARWSRSSRPAPTPARAALPAPQPHHRGLAERHRRGRGGGRQRLADHRRIRARAGARGVRRARARRSTRRRPAASNCCSRGRSWSRGCRRRARRMQRVPTG